MQTVSTREHPFRFSVFSLLALAITTVQGALGLLLQDEQLVELESLLAFFASFVLSSDVVRQIMRWDMAVLRESPWYQDILWEGERWGEQRGQQEGRQEEGRSLFWRQLTRRLGTLPPDLIRQVQTLSLLELEALGEALLEFTQMDDLVQWLDRSAREQ